jgi:hypothetical protein
MAYNYRGNQTYLQIVSAAEKALRALSPSQDKALPAKDLISRIRIENGSLTIGDPAILSYLSYAANHDTLTKIDTGGPRGGYWYNEEYQPSAQDESPVAAPTLREAHLYELVRYWFQAKNNLRAKDISQLKAGGLWSNPDIVGISSIDRLGFFDVEIVSAEVKLSEKEWQRYIFEAVSHKRFANRVYYFFRTKFETVKIPEDMYRYAEQYRVGIVTVPLTDDELARLGSGEEKANLANYVDRIVERVPAVYDFVPPRNQIEFLERIGLTQKEDILRFGLADPTNF